MKSTKKTKATKDNEKKVVKVKDLKNVSGGQTRGGFAIGGLSDQI